MARGAVSRAKFTKMTSHDRKQDKQIRQLLKKVGREEVKVFDDYAAAAALTTVSPLMPIAEGTGIKERVGLAVNLKHLAFRFRLHMNANATANPTSIRVSLVRDNQSDGAAPSYANCYPTDRVFSFINRTTMHGRFTLLYDKHINIPISATGVPEGQIGSGYFKKSWKVGKKVEFDGSAATDYHNGQIYLICKSSDAVNPPTITWESRALYTDS